VRTKKSWTKRKIRRVAAKVRMVERKRRRAGVGARAEKQRIKVPAKVEAEVEARVKIRKRKAEATRGMAVKARNEAEAETRAVTEVEAEAEAGAGAEARVERGGRAGTRASDLKAGVEAVDEGVDHVTDEGRSVPAANREVNHVTEVEIGEIKKEKRGTKSEKKKTKLEGDVIARSMSEGELRERRRSGRGERDKRLTRRRERGNENSTDNDSRKRRRREMNGCVLRKKRQGRAERYPSHPIMTKKKTEMKTKPGRLLQKSHGTSLKIVTNQVIDPEIKEIDHLTEEIVIRTGLEIAGRVTDLSE